MQRAYLDAETKVVRLPLPEGPAPARLVIDDTHFLFTAHFKKSGPDLILTGDDGKKLVITGYFNLEKHPDLVSPDGAIISADLVERLAGPDAPGQYAQAGAPAGAIVIGRVEIVGGTATVQHANGVVDNLKNGDSLLKGDVVMTGDGEGCTLSLIDGTALNMGSNARMVLAELTYESNSTSNSALINLVKGSFVFVAGQVAHTGDMKVSTPVATMGIRGTTVGTYLDADVNGNVYQLTATLLADPGGGSGAYDVLDPVTGVLLHRVRSTATQVTLTHGAGNQLSVQEGSKSPAIVQHEISVAQILFPIFLANPNNAQLNQTTPQVPNNSLTPPQLLPQPPQEPDAVQALHFTDLTRTSDVKTPSSSNVNNFLILSQQENNNSTSSASISIAAIAGDNIINLSRAQDGFAIAGNETGADGQTVNVKILDSGGNVVGSFTATAAGGSWFVGVSSTFAKALADGTYTLKATVSDADGNPAPPATQIVTVDETRPTAPGVALAIDSGSTAGDHITNNGALTLSGIEPGALVEYSIDGGTTWSNSFTAVEGQNAILIRQTDVAGNVSGATAFSFTLDNIAPAPPNIALTNDSGNSATDHITNNGALTLSGIEPGALVQYSINNGTTWSNSFTAVEGVNTVQVRQTDVAGNVSSATSLSFTLDSIAPAAPGVALTIDSGSSNSDHITDNGALTLSGIENGAIVQYSINNGTTWSNSFTAVEGVNAVQVRQTDVAGNVSAATTFSFTLDTHGPAAPGVALTTDSGSTNSDHITNNGALTLSGIEAGALVQYSIDNGQTWSNSFTAVEGLNTVQVRQTDVAGDVSSATSLSFTLDTIAPAAPGVALTTDSGSTNSDHITNNGALTLSGIENGAIVQYSINNGTTWSNSFTAVEGVNTVQVRQTDVAGNVSSATSLSFTLDSIAPAAPGVALTIDSGSSNSDHITDNGALTLSGIENGAIVQYSINNGTTWSNSFTAVEGVNAVQVRQTDVAGNVSAATTFSFTLDTHGPAAPGVALTTDSGSTNSDHITNNGALTLSGIEAGALVQYSIDNGQTWSNSFTAVEGLNTVQVRQTDVAGDVSSATSLSFTLDTIAPAAPGVALTTDSGSTNSDHITNNGALTLSGIENGAIVQYSINNGTTWSNSFTAVEGVNTVQVRQTDVAGNVSSATSLSFTLDSIAPAAPGVALTTDSGSSGSDHITNNGALTLSGIENGAIVQYSINNGTTWSNSFTAVEGVNTVQVRQTDVAGNVSSATSLSFTLDTHGPAAPGVALITDSGSSGSDHITNNGALTLSGIENGAIVQYSINNGTTWSNSFTAVEGVNTVQVRQTDVAGNVSSATSLSFTLDSIAPAAPGVALTIDSGSSNSDHITDNGALTLSGIENGAIVQYSINNGTTWSNSFTAVEGVNAVQVRQTDVAGNVSAATTFSFTLDTHGPAAPGVALTTDSGSTNSDHITNNGALTLSGIEAGALVQYSIDNGQTWSNSFTAVEGLNTVQVRQTDVAGDVSSATSLSFTLDTIAPAAPGVALTTDSGSSGSDHITNNGALTLSGIENGAIVQYSINNGTTWSNSFTAVEGVNTVQVRQTDVAGNVSSATSLSFTLDSIAPAAPGVALTIDSGSSGSDHITNNGALTLSGIENGAIVQYSINNGTTWSNSFTAVEGVNTVQVRQTDVAGNVSSATSLSFTLDTHGPAAPGVALITDSGSSGSDHITNNGALTLSGIENGAIVQYSINNGTTWSNSFTAVEGVNTVQVRQTDVAGNVSAPTTFSFTLDTLAPTITVAAITGDNIINLAEAQSGFLISGSETGADGQAVTVKIIDSSGAAVKIYTTTAGSGSWSVPVSSADATALNDGTYTVTASVSDAAGNSAAPATRTLTVHEHTDNWTGGNGNWSSNHWSNGVPAAGTDVLIDVAGTYTITISQPSVAQSLTISAAGATVKDTVSLQLSNALTINSGTFELANGSLQTPLILIGLAGLFLVDNGAIISQPVINNGTLEVAGGTLELAGALSGTGVFKIDAGAALQIDGADALQVVFTGSTGTLILEDPIHFTGTIAGLNGNAAIDLTNINSSTAHLQQPVSYDLITNISTLTVTDGHATDTLHLVGNYTASTWTFSSDGSGGTTVVDPITMVASLSTTVIDDSGSTLVIDPTKAGASVEASGTSVDNHHTPDPLLPASALHLQSSHMALPALDLTGHFQFEDTNTGSPNSHPLVQMDAGNVQPGNLAPAISNALFDQFHFGEMNTGAPSGQPGNLLSAVSNGTLDHFQFMDTYGLAFHQAQTADLLELSSHQMSLQTLIDAAAPADHVLSPAPNGVPASTGALVFDVHAIQVDVHPHLA